MQISDAIALIALFVSFAVFVHSIVASRSQGQLTKHEVELVRMQISDAKEAKAKANTASVSARMYKAGKSDWRVKIFNSGPSVALNVNPILDDENSLVSRQALEGKFPMEKMERGQSVEIHAWVHMTSDPKEWLTIQWEDPNGDQRENRVQITI